jgi:hypothetical protein
MKTLLAILLGTALVMGLVGAVYLKLEIDHHLNKTKSERLYHDAHGAFDQAAALRDADVGQFNAKYATATAAINAFESFNDHNALTLSYRRASSDASSKLRSCLGALQMYRIRLNQDPFKFHVKVSQEVDHCLEDRMPGTPLDVR